MQVLERVLPQLSRYYSFGAIALIPFTLIIVGCQVETGFSTVE